MTGWMGFEGGLDSNGVATSSSPLRRTSWDEEDHGCADPDLIPKP